MSINYSKASVREVVRNVESLLIAVVPMSTVTGVVENARVISTGK